MIDTPAIWMPQETIRRKRDGEALGADELRLLARGMADGSLADAQVAAFAMAVYFRGMTPAEGAVLTLAMRDTGEVFDWRRESLPGPVLDKHSTGGVGDLVSLVLGPMLAACGAYLPMITGRGLAHTGGTVDKLEAIPGYQTQPEPEVVRRTLREAGVAIIGAGDRIAPADRRLYAIRDVTATVDCIPLIVASILSKKLAAGSDALVLDIKTGNGAVLSDASRPRQLAARIMGTAGEAGLPTRVLLTDMSEPLARSAGNALEISETLAMLRGEPADARLMEVTLALGIEVMILGGLAANASAAKAALAKALATGAAAERFARMVAGLGGPADLMERPDRYLAKAPVVEEVPASRDGFITAIDTRALGLAVVALGGGRTAPGQAVDPAVGLDRLASLGASIQVGDPLARVHAASTGAARLAAQSVACAYAIGDSKPTLPALIERMDPGA
ncbi:MAG TPA: thymidine phosphorylase [Steroidobacteraceae bacterium]|nr:thymidine phosphorylase [Steroidobacteraceae bacterium]